MLRPHLLRKLTNLFALGQEVFLTPDKRFASLESMVDATNYHLVTLWKATKQEQQLYEEYS
jgi:hypothetical protein